MKAVSGSRCRWTRGRLVGNRKFEDETGVNKGKWCSGVLGHSVPQLRVTNTKGLITRGAELCRSVGETKCLKRGCRAAGGCRFFFSFLDWVQIKMLEMPRRLFVSNFCFLAASDEERLDRERRRWIHKRGIVETETSASVLIHYWSWQTDTPSHPWQSFSLPPEIHFFAHVSRKGGKHGFGLMMSQAETWITWFTLLIWG